MLPQRCFTCNKVLSHIELEYEEKLEEIELNDKISNEEKSKLKRELVDSFGLERYCCRKILISYVDLIKVVI
jgi:DNA-directed RNA polymerase subunit N (RpoN/RPB10)